VGSTVPRIRELCRFRSRAIPNPRGGGGGGGGGGEMITNPRETTRNQSGWWEPHNTPPNTERGRVLPDGFTIWMSPILRTRRCLGVFGCGERRLRIAFANYYGRAVGSFSRQQLSRGVHRQRLCGFLFFFGYVFCVAISTIRRVQRSSGTSGGSRGGQNVAAGEMFQGCDAAKKHRRPRAAADLRDLPSRRRVYPVGNKKKSPTRVTAWSSDGSFLGPCGSDRSLGSLEPYPSIAAGAAPSRFHNAVAIPDAMLVDDNDEALKFFWLFFLCGGFCVFVERRRRPPRKHYAGIVDRLERAGTRCSSPSFRFRSRRPEAPRDFISCEAGRSATA